MSMMTELATRVAALEAKVEALTTKRPPGRPLGASEYQAATVMALHADGHSLRAIAAETGMGVRTVRTVVEKAKGTDRTTRRRK